jgi:hypothetical protein
MNQPSFQSQTTAMDPMQGSFPMVSEPIAIPGALGMPSFSPPNDSNIASLFTGHESAFLGDGTNLGAPENWLTGYNVHDFNSSWPSLSNAFPNDGFEMQTNFSSQGDLNDLEGRRSSVFFPAVLSLVVTANGKAAYSSRFACNRWHEFPSLAVGHPGGA